jgi:AmiR/NasT family two-component response regulator
MADDDDADNGGTFADAESQRERMAQRLRDALRSRAVVHRAVGVVMEWENLSPEQALSVLSKAAQRVNVEVRAIAAEIVASTRGKDPEP